MFKSLTVLGCMLSLTAAVSAQTFVPSAPINFTGDVYGTSVTLRWERQDAGEVISGTDFEGDNFLPEGWTLKKTYSYNPNVPGNWEHWKDGCVNDVPYTHSGSGSALLRASGDGGDDDASWMQDEWIIMTPGIGAVYMDFWYYIHPNVLEFYDTPWEEDHYYVKISRDNGKTWRIIWDGRFDIDDQVAMRQATLFLGDPADENTLVAFNGVSKDTFKNMWAVDDVEFRLPASPASIISNPVTRNTSGDPDITYRIYLDGKLLKDNLKCLYYVDNSEKSETMHEYKVCAYNSATDTEYDGTTLNVNLSDELPCPPPTKVVAANDPDPDYDDWWYIAVYWDAPEGTRTPDSYEITMNGAIIDTLSGDNILKQKTTRFLRRGVYKMGVTAIYSSPAGRSETAYDFTFPGTVPTPRELKAELTDEGNVSLDWKYVEEAATKDKFTGYRLYRGDEMIGDNLTDTHFTDENVEDGIYKYSVHALYSDDVVSLPEITDIVINTPKTVTEIDENFTNGHLPANWEILMNDSWGIKQVMHTYGWRFDNWYGSDFSSIRQLDGGFASIDGEESGNYVLDTYLMTPVLEIPENHYPTISFTKGIIDDAFVKALYELKISTDGGETWVTVADLADVEKHPNGEVKLNLEDYAEKNVKFAWYYHSFMNGRAALDNVKVMATQLGGVDSIAAESATAFDVYNMSGIMLHKGISKESVDMLPAGMYVVKGNNGEVRKIMK